jgi:hypothetical protein
MKIARWLLLSIRRWNCGLKEIEPFDASELASLFELFVDWRISLLKLGELFLRDLGLPEHVSNTHAYTHHGFHIPLCYPESESEPQKSETSTWASTPYVML